MCTGTPLIIWGDNLDKSLPFTYPLYDWVTRSEALDGSQFLRIESGQEDAWIVDTSYVLEGTVRFIEDDGISWGWDNSLYGWQSFLEWARQKNPFIYFPDITSPGIESYLVEPITTTPTIEQDGTRSIRLVIRNSITPYTIGDTINTERDPLQAGTYPTGGLVLFVNNSISSYPGSGSTWFDISGNGIDFILSGSVSDGLPSFTRSTGFNFNGTSQFCTSGVSSSLATFYPRNTSITGSIAVVIAFTPDVIESANIFGQWEGPYSTQDQQYKFNTDLNTNATIEASVYGTSGSFAGNKFTNLDTTNIMDTDRENIIIWQITSGSSKFFEIYKDLVQAAGESRPIAGARWYGSDPEAIIGGIRSNAGVYTSFFDGKIRAVMMYNRALSAIERVTIQTYLQYTLP